MSNLKDILATYYRYGIKVVDKMAEDIVKDVTFLKTHPFHGYRETSMMKSPQKIHFFISARQVKIIYYVEDNNLYIIDFWDN